MDYRKLLMAYISHVNNCEGIDFIDIHPPNGSLVINDDEWRELRALSDMVDTAIIIAEEKVSEMPPGTERALEYFRTQRSELGLD